MPTEGNGWAWFDTADLADLWEDYRLLWWLFEGVRPSPALRVLTEGGLVRLAKLNMGRRRVDGTVGFRNRDVRDQRRENLLILPKRRPDPLPDIAEQWAVYRGLKARGYLRIEPPPGPKPAEA